MTELPVCSWREMIDGKARCTSPKVHNTVPFDPYRVCINRDGTACKYANHPPLTPEQLAARAVRPLPLPPPDHGPGTELKALLAELGQTPWDCACEARARQMNVWGIEGCKTHRMEIAAWLKESASKTVKEFSVDDSIEAFLPLVDEAIRRAEAIAEKCVGG